MKVLFVYPHPDDESFGPAPVMHKMVREGHEVHLLTLTRGGATKERHKHNYSVKKMGSVRYKEVMNASDVLGLTGVTILDFPDGGLKEVNPLEIENAVREEILRIEPYVVVTYPVHGISGFHDHLVTHAVVKRVYEELKEKKWFLRRLAFTTVDEKGVKLVKTIKLNHSTEEEIDCVISVEQRDIDAGLLALDCYKTYQDVINRVGIKKVVAKPYSFEFYQESFNSPVSDLFAHLPSE